MNGKGENGRGEGTSQEMNYFPGLPYGDYRGLAPRALEHLFDHFSKGRTGSTKVWLKRYLDHVHLTNDTG